MLKASPFTRYVPIKFINLHTPSIFDSNLDSFSEYNFNSLYIISIFFGDASFSINFILCERD